MCRIERFVLLACKLAKERNFIVRFPFACLITQGSKIISVGYNERKTDPFAVETRESYLHAELDAIKRAGTESHGATMFIARKRKTGFGIAKPCPICAREILRSGIRKIVFTNSSTDLSYSVVKL